MFNGQLISLLKKDRRCHFTTAQFNSNSSSASVFSCYEQSPALGKQMAIVGVRIGSLHVSCLVASEAGL